MPTYDHDAYNRTSVITEICQRCRMQYHIALKEEHARICMNKPGMCGYCFEYYNGTRENHLKKCPNVPTAKPVKAVNARVQADLEDRDCIYGGFSDTAFIAQSIKAAMRDCQGWHRLKSYQKEALEMMANKLSRVLNGNPDHVDSWYDIAGYATLCVNEIEKKKK